MDSGGDGNGDSATVVTVAIGMAKWPLVVRGMVTLAAVLLGKVKGDARVIHGTIISNTFSKTIEKHEMRKNKQEHTSPNGASPKIEGQSETGPRPSMKHTAFPFPASPPPLTIAVATIVMLRLSSSLSRPLAHRRRFVVITASSSAVSPPPKPRQDRRCQSIVIRRCGLQCGLQYAWVYILNLYVVVDVVACRDRINHWAAVGLGRCETPSVTTPMLPPPHGVSMIILPPHLCGNHLQPRPRLTMPPPLAMQDGIHTYDGDHDVTHDGGDGDDHSDKATTTMGVTTSTLRRDYNDPWQWH
ncbi:hypothetical protein EDB85DRAFT_1888950 [Lactarius pseudohatsudake]|nr:hypothetical protein EDB85DRAFT_1888950 [Lactarius pseudohatsudake]